MSESMTSRQRRKHGAGTPALLLDTVLYWCYNGAMTNKNETYSLNVRFPRSLQGQMQTAAKIEGRSINGLIVTAVRHHLGLETALADRLSHPAATASSSSPLLLERHEGRLASAD